MPKSEKIFMPQQPSLVRTTIHTSLSHKFRNIGTKNGVTLSKSQDGLDLSKVSNVGTGLDAKKINMLALNLPRKLSIRPQNKTESLYLHDNKKWQDLESGDSHTESIPDQRSAKAVAGQQDNFIQNNEQVPILSEHNIQKPLDIQYPPLPPQHPSQHIQIEMMTVHAPAHAATPKAVGTIGSDISLLLPEQNTYIKDNAKASIDMCEVHDIYHAEDTSTSRSSVLTPDNTLPSVSGLASEPTLQAPKENAPKTKPVPASMRWAWQVWSNRIFACAFAVVLLWLTSLQLAIDLAQANISVPPFSFISDTCVESYNQMNSQKQKYSDCSSRQLKQCQQWLDNSVTQEIHRVQGIQSAQREMLENATAQNQQCSLVWAGFVTQFQTYETSALANVTSTGHVPTSTTASLPKAAMNPLAYNPICTGAEIYTLRNALSLVHVQKQLQLAAQQKSARSQEQQNADAQQRSNNQFQEKKRTGLLVSVVQGHLLSTFCRLEKKH